MDMRQTGSSPLQRSRVTLAVVGLYAAFAALWILASDSVAAWLFTTPEAMALVSVFKGWVFVAVTSLLLYGLLRRWPAVSPKAAPPTTAEITAPLKDADSGKVGAGGAAPSRLPLLPAALIAIAITVLTAGGMAYHVKQTGAQEVARLRTIADLKAREIGNWLVERQRDCELIQDSGAFPTLFQRWQQAGDMEAGRTLQQLLGWFVKNDGISGISLLDGTGQPVWRIGDVPEEQGVVLRESIGEARRLGHTTRVGPYLGMRGTPRLDFVAPSGAMTVVLHVDPEAWLFPMLQDWPGGKTMSGDAVLVRRDGDDVLFLNALRFRPEAMLKQRMPLTQPDLPAARALRGEVGADGTVDGSDYRGVPVRAVVSAVPGTDWQLLVKMDRVEVYRDALAGTVWLGLAGLLALFLVGVGLLLLRQRQISDVATAKLQAQADRLSTLQLLDAIATNSTDLIFAIDRAGRFTLFNPAAAALTGHQVREIIGRDETCLFPPELAAEQIADNRRIMENDVGEVIEETIPFPQGTRTMLVSKTPLHDAAGKVVGLCGISRDITERKRSEDALRQSEKTYRSLFANMLNGFAHCRMLFEQGRPADFIYLKVNDAFVTQTGLKDVTGRRISEVVPGFRETDQDLLDIYGRVSRGGAPEHFDMWVEALQQWFSISVYCPQPDEFVAIFDVISERKRIEAALRDSEQRFHEIFNNMSNGVAVYEAVDEGADFVFKDFNPAAERIERIARDEVVGRRLTEVFPGVAAFGLLDVLRRVWRSGESEAFPIRHYEDERIAGWRENYICHLTSDEVVTIYDDITEQKRAEAELIQSETRFHDIVEASADWIWEVNAAGCYTYASESVAKLLGYTPAEVIGRTPFDFMPPGEAVRMRAEFAAIAAGKAPFRDLYNITVHKDGSLHHVWSNGMPIFGADGDLRGYRGLDRDITEMKYAERELLEARDQLHSLVNAIPDLIWLKDADGRYLACNHRFEQFFGAREAEIIGKTDYDFVPRDLADFFRTNDLAAIKAGRPRENEEEVTFASDGHREILLTIKVPFLDRDGRPVGVLGIARDITERKAAEAELQARNDELERFNRVTVGRELDMLEMKRTINQLSQELGRAPPYALDFLREADGGEAT